MLPGKVQIAETDGGFQQTEVWAYKGAVHNVNL